MSRLICNIWRTRGSEPLLQYVFRVWINLVQGHNIGIRRMDQSILDVHRSSAARKRSSPREPFFTYLAILALTFLVVCQSSDLALAQQPANSPPGEAVKGTLSLEDALELARQRNPELVIARKRLEVARAAITAAQAFPNPEVILEGEPSLSGDEYNFSFGVEQRLPLYGRIGKRRSLAEKEYDRDSAGVDDVERRVLGAVRQIYRAAQTLGQRVRVAEEILALNEGLAAIAEARFTKGEVSELDVHQFKIESSRGRQELIELSSRRVTALIALSRELDIPYQRDLRLEDARGVRRDSLPFESLLRVALARSSIRSLRFERSAAERQIAVERAERWNDPSLNLFFRKERTSFAEVGGPLVSDEFLGAELRIPLPLFYGRKGEIAQAAARVEVADASLMAERVLIDREVRDAYQRTLAALKTVEGYGEGIRTAEQAQRLGEQAYAQGLVGAVQLIQVQRQLLEVKEAQLDALDAYNQAISDLEAAVGLSVDQALNIGVGENEGELR